MDNDDDIALSSATSAIPGWSVAEVRKGLAMLRAKWKARSPHQPLIPSQCLFKNLSMAEFSVIFLMGQHNKRHQKTKAKPTSTTLPVPAASSPGASSHKGGHRRPHPPAQHLPSRRRSPPTRPHPNNPPSSSATSSSSSSSTLSHQSPLPPQTPLTRPATRSPDEGSSPEL